MRVLALTNAYPPHYYGGYELTCRDVMDRFTRRGVSVMVLTSSARRPGVADQTEPTVRRHLHPFWDWNRNQSDTPLSPLSRLRLDRRNRVALRSALDEFDPDVVSVWNMCGMSVSLLTLVAEQGRPVVLTVANDWLRLAPQQDPWARLVTRCVPGGKGRAELRWAESFHAGLANFA